MIALGQTSASIALALGFAVAACACNTGRAGPTASVDAAAEATALATFLPPRLGAFSAVAPASTTVDAAGPKIEAFRSYRSGDGREATVRLTTGDLTQDLATLDSDDEHAFGSDTPTYWRTTAIVGHRTRVAEERPTPVRSECLVRVGPKHVAHVSVAPAPRGGACVDVASRLDFAGIVASGGVAGPPPSLRR